MIINVSTAQSLCARYNIHPSKKLGQNFLIDSRIARIVLDSADLKPNDCVVEVGPGFGVLTMELVKRAKKIVAVEIDKRMAQALTEIGSPLCVLNQDILRISNQELCATLSDVQAVAQHSVSGLYKVVANLPYSITSAVLRKFTEEEPRPELMVVMVQKEVAERVCAKPGDMSILSVAIQYYGKPEIIAIVPRSAFWPEPEVDSAILRIRNYELGIRGLKNKKFFQIVRIGFSSRRKQLQNNLMVGLRLTREQAIKALAEIGLGPKVRAQELSVSQWIELVSMLS